MGVTESELLADLNRWLLYNDAQALGILSADDRRDIIGAAVKQYSKKRPYLALQVYTGTSSNFYDIPDSWEDGFSSFQEIEYPIENTPKSFIPRKDYCIDLMGSGLKLRFNANNPTSNIFWVKFFRRHTFDSAGGSNIPVSDETALSYLCVSLTCEAFATHFASKADPSLPEAEVISYTARVTEYRDQAEEWMKKYETELKDENSGVYGEVKFTQDNFWNRSND